MNNTGLQVLQRSVFSVKEGIPRELYYRGSQLEPRGEAWIAGQGTTIDLTSYFNLFSWEKWQKYTGINSLSFIIEAQGRCLLTIQSLNKEGKVKACRDFPLVIQKEDILRVPESLLSGHIAVKIKTQTPLILKSACWACESAPYRREVSIAAVICTYNRDEYLFPCLEVLKNTSANSVDTIIIDNASRLEERNIGQYGSNFHLFHNPNTGGSGGFTRGILEALGSRKNYTHVLLMDDDIQLEAETIVRTETLLSLLKPEYRKHFIAGSMLLLDEPHIMFESTAQWAGYRAWIHNHSLDLTDLHLLCRADEDFNGSNQYAGWWFCGIPLTEEIREDLPFPFFIYGDDIDYSLKRASGFLILNGIGVWHESFAKKFTPLFKSYFFCRNTLILNSLHRGEFTVFHSIINSMILFWAQIFVHDYRSAILVLDAVEDFLKGADYITALDELELLNRKQVPLDFQFLADSDLSDCYPVKGRIKRWSSIRYLFHKQLAVFNYSEEMVEIRKRSWKSVISLFLRSVFLSVKFLLCFSKAGKSFRNIKRDEMFWQNRFKKYQE